MFPLLFDQFHCTFCIISRLQVLDKMVILIAYVLISRTYQNFNGYHGVVIVKYIKTVQKNHIFYLRTHDNLSMHAFYYIIKLATSYVIKRWARNYARLFTRLCVLFSYGAMSWRLKVAKTNYFRDHTDFMFLEKKSHISHASLKVIPSPQVRLSIFFS